MGRFSLTRLALQDLQDIGDYIAKDNSQAALNFVGKIRIRCDELSQSPRTGRKRKDVEKDVRSATQGDYVIFYHIVGTEDIPVKFKVCEILCSH